MNQNYIQDQTFKGKDFSQENLPLGDYENCTFINCNFSESDFSGFMFSECEFDGCDLSMVKLADTSFRKVRFKNGKLMGLRFEYCNPFLLSFNFEGCILDFSSFYKLKIKNLKFKDCSLKEAEFVESEFPYSSFENCDLNGAVFQASDLEGADFRTAYGFSLDPEVNKITRAKFSIEGLVGLLEKYKLTIT